MDGLLLLASTVRSIGYSGRGDFILEKDGRLTRRPERTVAPFVYAVRGDLSRRLFEDAPEGAFSLNVLFDRAIAAGRLFGVRLTARGSTWRRLIDEEAATEAIAASAA